MPPLVERPYTCQYAYRDIVLDEYVCRAQEDKTTKRKKDLGCTVEMLNECARRYAEQAGRIGPRWKTNIDR